MLSDVGLMIEQKSTRGKIVVVSGPSGVGKSTICKEAVKCLKNTQLSVSVTTREKSDTEVDGVDYRFISEEEFQQRINAGLILEYAEVFGSMYGTPKDGVVEALKAGKNVILEIDVKGGKQVKNIYDDAVMIFILPPTHKELKQRMDNRGRDGFGASKERLNGASEEIAAAWQYYQYMVINDILEQAVKEVVEIIQHNTGDK